VMRLSRSPASSTIGSDAPKGPEGPFVRRLSSPDRSSEHQLTSHTWRPFFRSALGLDDCRPLTKDEHRFDSRLGAPPEGRGHPRTGHREAFRIRARDMVGYLRS
jgi:hypothetical protein